MKQRLIVGFVLLALTLYAGATLAFSDGSFISEKTGAPGEDNCSTCHGNLNSGSGSIEFTAPDGYTPGATYDFSLVVEQSGQRRWGFQLTALDASDEPAGDFTVSDVARIQETQGSNGRVYLTHTPFGTDAGTLNMCTGWSFKWTAPSSNVGDITFYIAGLAANNDDDTEGDFTYTTIKVLSPATPVSEGGSPALPVHPSLSQNFPNPFNPETTIEYDLPRSEQVSVEIFNIRGQRVAVLQQGYLSAGHHLVSWNGVDQHGVQVASGIYMYRLRAGDYVETKRMTLLK